MENKVFQSYLKSPYKSIKHTTYFRSYEHFFEKYRGKEFTFIEIGVLAGGSLFMWRDYFGPKARIIGIDLNPNAKKWEKYGFEIFIGNQSDELFWKKVLSKVDGIDVVLDDGGHTYEQQIITVESIVSAMNDGGLIVVEDTHTSYMDGFGPKEYSYINYVKSKIDQINFRFNFTNQFNNAERRIWSIEIVESMVAFKIDREASKEISKPISNNGKDDTAEDFRYDYDENVVLQKFYKTAKKLKFLEFIPFARSFYNLILSLLTNRKSYLKKYFK
jgi:hypothetical protein